MASDLIRDRGRGPELKRVRVTVYDLIPYLEGGHFTDDQITHDILRITPEELAALKQYIADHRDEVLAANQKINDRHAAQMAAQQTPEFQARFWWNAERRTRFLAWLREREGTAANDTGHKPTPAEFVALSREFRALEESRTPAPEAACSE